MLILEKLEGVTEQVLMKLLCPSVGPLVASECIALMNSRRKLCIVDTAKCMCAILETAHIF